MGPVYFVLGFSCLLLSGKALSAGQYVHGFVLFALAPFFFFKCCLWMRGTR